MVTGSDVDAWGRSERVRAVVRRLSSPIYRGWFRVAIEGLARIPATGGALLVANHAGALPVDGALLVHGIEQATGRPVYGLHHWALRAAPFLGTVLARNGGVVANPANAHRLLAEEAHLVLVFPEGAKGTTKPYSQRYRLQRFGRGGFIEVAMRAGVPVLPVAVAGTEEAMPALFTLGSGDRRVPFTANAAVFGPVGAWIPWPVKIRARILEPVRFDVPAELGSYGRRLVADGAEQVRQRLQLELDRMVPAARRGGSA
jgi:1-acyl-sn-glycerol-3-phosphate acyltransferase